MKKGISLIALIITIIVIIILAAITINGVSGILERSRYAKFCADLDAIQEAVSQAYGTAILEEAKKPGEKRNSEEIYKELAGGSERSYKDKTLYQLTDEKVLGLKLPTYGTSNWYVDVKTGEVYLLSGFEYEGKIYRSKADIQGGGEDTDYARFHSVITVNIPTGSIPVIHNGSNWVIADKNSDWYDYREDVRQWANVFTFDNDMRDEYLSKPAGTVITDEQIENDVIGMFVYVPRYAYQITSYLHAGGNVEGDIDIVFINKQNQDCDGKVYSEEYPTTTLDGKDPSVAGTKEDKMNDFVVHPAFTDNIANGGWEHDLDGIWIAKFEASSSTTELVKDESTDTVVVEGEGRISTNIGSNCGWSKNVNDETEFVVVRPNVTSWRNIDVRSIINKSRDVALIHGLVDSTSHQMKNSEWGAVAYLTHSKYGNTNLYTNFYCEGDDYWTSVTGMSGAVPENDVDNNRIKTAKTYMEDGSIKITYKNIGERIFYPYNHLDGYHASSTDNIYGIYDLAGGACDCVAGYTSTPYEDAYIYDYERNKYSTGYSAKNFGDAIYETSRGSTGGGESWNNDWSAFSGGLLLRGDDACSTVYAGVFGYVVANQTWNIVGFRVVFVQ